MNQELKRSLWEAHDGLCFYTGIPITMFDMHIDYIQPLSKGGNDELNNLVPCCSRAKKQKANIFNENTTKQIIMFNSLVYTPKVEKLFNKYKIDENVCTKKQLNKYFVVGYNNISVTTPVTIDDEFLNYDGKICKFDGLKLPDEARVKARKAITIYGERKEYKKTFFISNLEDTIKKANDYINGKINDSNI
ncbi:hypothetical protein GCM10012288_05370 [Malaciobacter pacificus]|uniref:HNH endonuclease domain-containing protein n=1 Tax=Malaciobacter pacificus TaxID=1080223 RepID=A0A5C2HAB7_9BACT|nr:HNH endonuclease signature motif containing protein [Malaciobacter pacificus]QEP34465.1 HNH endonuclease domain-containing protein [Malaciobacter pacificus]GGD34344.1 hypothetical protein GCM10012288_05370 [Malaciobacter pacificus]